MVKKQYELLARCGCAPSPSSGSGEYATWRCAANWRRPGRAECVRCAVGGPAPSSHAWIGFTLPCEPMCDATRRLAGMWPGAAGDAGLRADAPAARAWSLEETLPMSTCHEIAKQYAGMKIQSMTVQRRAFNRQKSSAESRRAMDGPVLNMADAGDWLPRRSLRPEACCGEGLREGFIVLGANYLACCSVGGAHART